MKKYVVFLLFFLAGSLYARVKIVTSIFPLYSIVNEVVGDRGEVVNILPPNVSPHIFEPTPRDIIKLHGADLFVYVGDKVEPWAKRLLEGVGSRAEVLKFSDVVTPENNNYHFWLDPVLVEKFVKALVKKLIKIDPSGKSFYSTREKELLERLSQLDSEFRKTLSKIKNRHVIFFHNAWYYLAKRYDLKVVDVIVKGEGRKPTPADMVRLTKDIKKYGIEVIFGERIGGVNMLKKICENLGVDYLLLDPLGCSGCSGRDSYFAMMRYNLKTLVEGLNK